MKTVGDSYSKLSIVIFCLIAAVALCVPMCGQQASAVDPVVRQNIDTWVLQKRGMPNDWSHHHVIFSNPGTREDAVKNGTYEHWLKITSDPRFTLQQVQRGGGMAALEAQGLPVSPLVSPIDRFAPEKKKKNNGLWTMSMGSNATVGASQYPAKFSFSYTQAYCDNSSTPDFVVYNTGLPSSTSQPSIIAYDNLYTGCTGSHPLVYFQYNTIAGNTIPTSVVLAEDGIQLAFIQKTSSNVASLVVLKSARNTIGSSASLVNFTTSNASYRTCTAPCMIQLPLNGGPNVTYSSPYYDYINDVLYVGDDSGVLHKFQNIFLSGTPAEITGGGTTTGWPQNIATKNSAGTSDSLSSPVYDPGSGNVLVFLMTNQSSHGAKLARIPAAGGSNNIIFSAQLGDPSSNGYADGPLVDSNAGTAYVFLDGDTSGNAAVFRLTTTFTSGSAGNEQTVGIGYDSTHFMRVGTFDNIYYNSENSNPTSPTGNLYVCGRDTSGNDYPTLYRIAIASNALSTMTAGPALTTRGADCSPITEFYNSSTSTDWIFLSVTGRGQTASPISCPTNAGCIMSFNVTSASGFGTSKATTARATEASGTSGIIIDNSASSPTGTSQVYFSPLANQTCAGNGSTGSGSGGCATQASQSALN